MANMVLGFSTGCLYKTHNSLDPHTIDIFRKVGCNAIELMFHDSSDLENFKKLRQQDVEGFKYIALHAPIYRGENEEEYIQMLQAIEEKYKTIKFDSVVLHPDEFKDYSFLKRFELPFAVENMDNRKNSCKDIIGLKNLFQEFNVPMVFDINHAYTNDQTMKLGNDLVNGFKDRINEIHLSGFDTFHEPLFQTKQAYFMDFIPDLNLPIIIESGLDSPRDIHKEFEYIRNYLNLKNSSN
ncbi:MAG: hypothetical protein M1355_03680 [Patescibacteria group bacterium]|nr:hypothetical protein [Patescibacteria group bacterium]